MKEQNKKLKRKNAILKNENEKINTKLNGLLKSKSWKLTAPFRLIIQKSQK